MTTASDIKSKLDAGSWAAFTLAGGYAVPYRGQRLLFETGTVTKERRHANGRVVHSETGYKDGSTLTYRYSENSGYTLTAKEK